LKSGEAISHNTTVARLPAFFILNKVKKVGSFLFKFSDNYFSLNYHRLRSCCNSIRELKPDNQRWGRW